MICREGTASVTGHQADTHAQPHIHARGRVSASKRDVAGRRWGARELHETSRKNGGVPGYHKKESARIPIDLSGRGTLLLTASTHIALIHGGRSGSKQWIVN